MARVKKTLVSTLEGQTTGIDGRFLINGPSYQLLADASLRGGGPGEAIGPLDLLVASLIACALNVFRKNDLDDADEPSRRVECFARVERSDGDDEADRLGTLTLEIFVDGASRTQALELVEVYKENCRVFGALRQSLDVDFIVHTPEADLSVEEIAALIRASEARDRGEQPPPPHRRGRRKKRDC